MKRDLRQTHSALRWLVGGILLIVLAACSSVEREPGVDPNTALPPSPAQVTSDLPASGSGVKDEVYTFTFTYDENLVTTTSFGAMAAGDQVIFSWTFGDGKDPGTATVTVGANGKVSLEVTHAYDKDGRYGIVFGVEDTDGNVLATNHFIVEIGELTAQTFSINASQCDGVFFAGGSGQFGTSLHDWDVSGLQPGTVLDFKFNTWGIPDKFVIEYPVKKVVYDSGWRGYAYHDGEPLYPGGVVAPEVWSKDALITVTAEKNFLMTIIGPDSGTEWEYQIACSTSR